MDDKYRNSTDAGAAQPSSFTALPHFQQVYITDLVLGPAAAVTLARRHRVDLARCDWWRLSLTPQAKRKLEDQARDVQRCRKAEAAAARANAKAPKPIFDATPRHKARNALGRAK
jgi:hypothetical protein